MEQLTQKKWLWITLGVITLLFILGGLFWFFGRGKNFGGTIAKILPFGAPGEDVTRDGQGTPDENTGDNSSRDDNGVAEEPVFRQLGSVPVAGIIAIEKDGKQYARYIEKATAHIYEVELQSDAKRRLTNTTIPRIALADWALGGDAVIVRYLEKDPFSLRDVVKTNLAKLELPATVADFSEEGVEETGSLTISFLPDNITALSVSPDGKNLFYLLKTGSGVSGSIVNIKTKVTKEIFRNSFSEWLPQLMNNGDVLLTTKPSGAVPGYAYRYNADKKILERLVREKKGLTTLANALGLRALYGENISQDVVLGVYNSLGFPGDEGLVLYERALSLNTLPEKCVWLLDGVHAFCGSFTTNRNVLIPDLWYQGALSLSDTFWSINTDTDDVAFLADPKTEIGQEFDVINPVISVNEKYFIFINKKDGTPWSFRVSKEILTNDTAVIPSDEQGDAQGSIVQ